MSNIVVGSRRSLLPETEHCSGDSEGDGGEGKLDIIALIIIIKD